MNALVADGTITSEAAQAIMQSCNKKILEKYPQKQGSDGSWHAVIRFAPGKEGRKVLRRKERSDLQGDIIAFVNDLSKQGKRNTSRIKEIEYYPYCKAFEAWIVAQNYKNVNTEMRNKREYNRFFVKLEEGRKLSNVDIRNILSSDIERLMAEAIQTYDLTMRKAVEDYNMFFKSIYRQAIADRILEADQNPCLFVINTRFTQYAKSEWLKTEEERIILPQTETIISAAIKKDHEKDESYMPAFAAELSALTAMRCGELAGLWWKNVDFENNVIRICQSQKYNEKEKSYYIAEVKNKRPRIIPLTNAMKDVFDRIAIIQKTYGKFGDYVFSTKDGFTNSKQISDYMQNKKAQYKIAQPISIHAQRRTINSRMENSGVSGAIRSAILGHTEVVNRKYYTNDTTTMEEKKKILERASVLK